jgi:CRISPR-associated endonuclease/helicase Cas3
MANSMETSEPHKLPWGKLRDRNSVAPNLSPRLSLVAHCIDVAAVMKALLALPALRQRLDSLAARTLSATDLERLCALTFLHDIGKAGAGFYSRGVAPDVLRAWQAMHPAGRLQSGHVSVVAPLFEGDDSFDELVEALGVERVVDWGPDAADLWLAAISHHGEPVTVQTLRRNVPSTWPTWKSGIDGYQPLHGLAQLGQVVRSLFPDAFVTGSIMQPCGPALVHAFAGLVSLADWIGSNTDEAFFPYDLEPRDAKRWPVARARAAQVLVAMRLDVDSARVRLQNHATSFDSVFGYAARPMQLEASRTDLGALVALEAETGSGKTEAALWRFKTLFESGQVDALCFLLPTRVAASAIYERVQRFVDALFANAADRPTVLLAVPGYLRANGIQGERGLAPFTVLWPDSEGPDDTPRFWAAENSKRYFAGSVVAATIDQFLLSALATKHSHMRASLLLRALVVVDEVHASDAYMTALLHAALERHIRAGGHGLLMSATLTGEARARLLLAGADHRVAKQQRAALAAPDAPYPCVSSAGGLIACASAGDQKQVRCQLLPHLDNPEAVAECVAQAVEQGARVLVLRNTVRKALATQQAIEQRLGASHPALFTCNGVNAMHHGRYAFEDRRKLDAQVELQFGKTAFSSAAACVLVGTQTLEISIDCDADLMITDLVPIDVLLQRLGRLHRHRARDPFRPAAYQQAQLLVLTPEQRDLSPLLQRGGAKGKGFGPGSAYENLLAIEATWRLLEDETTFPVLSIPADNRRLVEAGVDSERLDALAQTLSGSWPEHLQTVLGKQGAQAGQATYSLVRWDKPWAQAAWSDLGETARTRLGLNGIDIALLQPWQTPLGCLIKGLSLPAWMLPAACEAGHIQAQDSTADELKFCVAERWFSYDRLGLRPA